MKGIRDAVYMADLITIVGWNWALCYSKIPFCHGEDNLGIEVPIVWKRFKWNPLESIYGVKPVSRVVFRKLQARHVILAIGQDPVS